VIPTMILFGLIFGRWPRPALAVAALGWPALLVATGVQGLGWHLFAAAALSVANALVGVLIHQAVLGIVRRLHRTSPHPG